MNKNILITIGIMILLALPLCSALVYQQDKEVDLKVPCFNNGTYCSAVATCNITILYPNGSVMVNNQLMTNSGSYHNYTLSIGQTHTIGEYSATMVCDDNSNYGKSDFTYLITTTGLETTISGSISYSVGIFLLTILMIVCIIFCVKSTSPGGKLLSGGLAYLFLISISFTIWLTSANLLSVPPYLATMFRRIFIILMIISIPLIISAIAWYFWMLINQKAITRMIEDGVPYDEATTRRFGNKGKKFKW